MKEYYDVVVIGAGFAGLSFAIHLSPNLSVLVVDRKNELDDLYESTGLMTTSTKELLESFAPESTKFITNSIDSMYVVGTDFKKHFISSANEPWIYSTDTPKLIQYISTLVTENVKIVTGTSYIANTYNLEEKLHRVKLRKSDIDYEVDAKFLVGADGGRSIVAKNNILSVNKKFLYGYEKMFLGDITFEECEKNAVYHYWFGEFSLGYGGWLSPTVHNGKKAFRIGLAKLDKDASDIKVLDDFIDKLVSINHIKIDELVHSYIGSIPISGVRTNYYRNSCLIIGDAGGMCGAFAADGIKGALVSGIVGAKLVSQYFETDNIKVFKSYFYEVNKFNNLIIYLYKQLLYRFIWNMMKRNSTFDEMFNIISREKELFIQQFADAKSSGTGLLKMILRPKQFKYILKYGILILWDLIAIP